MVHFTSSWRVASLVVLLALSVLLFTGGPEQLHERSAKALWDLGHVAYFFVLTSLLLGLHWWHTRSWQQVWLINVALAACLGASIEVIQLAFSRSSSWLDLGGDLVGTLLALSLHRLTLRGASPRARRTLRLLSVLLLMAACIPLARALFDELQARQQFPLLADFSTPLELDRWQGPAPFRLSSPGPESGLPDRHHALQISLQTSGYSGVSLDYPLRDWRGFGQLVLELFLPGDAGLTITLRVHDFSHTNTYADRFNKVFELHPGNNVLRVPLAEIESAPRGRSLDLAQIESLMLFSSALPAPRTVYLKRVYLEVR